MQQINLDCKEKFYNQNKNTIHKVLIEEVVDEKFSLGYTGNYIYTYIDAKCKPGEIVEVRLTDLYNNGMKNSVKIVIDDKIPFIRGLLEPFARVCYLPPVQITRQAVSDADALIVRTRTRCDERLLDGSSVRFIGTATIGTDHVDIPYCEACGIVWKNAPGCNAVSVAQYVSSVVASLALRDGFEVTDRCIGIVGVGHVGTQVERMCRALGMRVLLNDPPREVNEGREGMVSLEQIAQECDIISLHTPLTHVGSWPTFHFGG